MGTRDHLSYLIVFTHQTQYTCEYQWYLMIVYSLRLKLCLFDNGLSLIIAKSQALVCGFEH